MARMSRPPGAPPRQQSFGAKVVGGIQTAAKYAGIAKTVYDTGRTLYQIGQAAAPIVAALV